MKTHALLFAIILFVNTNIFSQNSGPLAPEAMSFEPIDVTDMVNLATGDFSYVIPVINIPGPDGGYPLALSYHAGVAMDEEASWVGLGWSLNPGAITRNINGFPDDENGGEVFELSSRANVETSRSGSLDLSVTPGAKMLTSLGVTISWGDNKGFGGYVELGLGSNSDYSIKGGTYISADYIETFYSLGHQLGSVGIHIGSGGVYGGIEQSYSAVSMDYSISSGKSSIGLSLAGESLFSTNSNYSTTRSAYLLQSIYIPIITPWATATISSFKREYFYSSDLKKKTFGTLYSSNAYHQSGDHLDYDRSQALDYLMDVVADAYGYKEFGNKDDQNTFNNANNNLLYPSYDAYNVSAQGIGGSIAPRIFQSGMIMGESLELKNFMTGVYNNDYDYINEEIRYHTQSKDINRIDKTSDNIYFYFTNEVSSYLNIDNGTFSDPGDEVLPLWGDFTFSGGGIDIISKNGFSNYNSEKKRKISGQVVEWFSNTNIRNSIAKSKGFIEDDKIFTERRVMKNSTEYDNTFFEPDGIGGFMVIDIDGKTYHYTIPVYQFGEYMIKQGGFDPEDFFIYENLNKYSNSWLLTAVTGPDYVDENNDGKISDGDWGYWVKFSYGKWSDGYLWQLPYIKETNKPYRFGLKQVYYLNSVETKTHIAYFVKSLREDAKSKTKNEEVSTVIKADESITSYEIWESQLCNCSDESLVVSEVGPFCGYLLDNGTFNININLPLKQSSLKLEKIMLFKKPNTILENTGNSVSQNVGNINRKFRYYFVDGNCEYSINQHYVDEIAHYGFNTSNGAWDDFALCNKLKTVDFNKAMIYNNVIDVNDLPANVESNALKVVDFTYDYSQCPNTPNSEAENYGKLTLKSLDIKGTGGRTVIPSFQFTYYQESQSDFDLDRRDDWGFDFYHPENWSLKEITSPIGGKIQISYEPDSYIKEASLNEQNYYIYGENGTVDQVSDAYINVTFSIPEKYNLSDILSNALDYEIAGSVNGNQELQKWQKVLNKYEDPGDYSKDRKSFYSNSNPLSYNISERKITFQIPFVKLIDRKDDCNDEENNYKLYFIANDVEDFTIKISTNQPVTGGGLRTSKIRVIGDDGKYNDLSYNYNTDQSNLTSGVISYAPGRVKHFYIPYFTNQPAPIVIYKNVRVINSGSGSNSDNYTLFEFRVPQSTSDFKSSEYQLGDIVQVTDEQDNYSNVDNYISKLTGDHSGNIYARSTTVSDFTSSIGRPEKTVDYNKDGDKLNEIKYSYFEPGELENGIVGENYQYVKRYIKWKEEHQSSESDWHFNSTNKITYPNILKSVETKTNNIISTKYFNSFDFYTGLATETSIINANGDVDKVISVPAYIINEYDQMGSKADNIGKSNMLSQSATEINYKNNQVIGVSVQTWNGTWSNYLEWNTSQALFEYNGEDSKNIWRKEKTFAWKGALTDEGAYASFPSVSTLTENWDDYFGADGNDNWLKTSQVIRYDHYSTPIEVSDVNGDFAATKKDPEDAYVIASAANSSLTSFAATSFESKKLLTEFYHYGAQVLGPESGSSPVTSSVIEPHTGYNSLRINSGNIGCRYLANGTNLLKGQKYRASVWITNSTLSQAELKVKLDGVVQPNTQTTVGAFGKWTLVNLDFDVASTNSSYEVYVQAVGGNCYIDDFRVSPYDAAVTSYTYDNAGNVTAILNTDNFATKYVYDAAGRLTETHVEKPTGFEKVASYKYNYAEQFGVDPLSVQPYSYKGLTNQRFDVSCTNTNWTVSVPSWMTKSEQGADYFNVTVPAVACSTLNTGTITITSSTGQKVYIPVEQEQKPQLKVTYPAKNQVFNENTMITFSWDYCYPGGTSYDIVWDYALNNNFSDPKSIETNFALQQQFQWTTPTDAIKQGDYSVVIGFRKNGIIEHQSEPFIIHFTR